MPKPNGKGIGEIATENSDTISKLHVKLNLKRIGIFNLTSARHGELQEIALSFHALATAH